MTTHDFGTTLPLGICSTCLARMVDPKVGMPARTLALPDGRTIFAVYCEHNVGAVGRGYGSASSQIGGRIGGRFGDPTGTRWIRGDDCRAV
jgi:hypothetical protein